ncbi:MAG: ATP-binding protein [Bryobacteraceae bacterium]|jgi:two-component system phosphate regulon sensor histidine kinase PhoR
MPRLRITARLLPCFIALTACSAWLLHWLMPAAPPGHWLRASAALGLAGTAVLALFLAINDRRALALRRSLERLLEMGKSETRRQSRGDELSALAATLEHATRRVRAMVETLQRENSRREAILGSMVEGVVAVDPLLRITFANRAYAEMMGAAAPPAAGTPLVQVTRDPALHEMFTAVFAAGQPLQKRLVLSASTRSFEVQVAPLAGDPHRGAIAMLYDITGLERLERVRKDFVANVSHELRTPLAAICGYAETLIEGGLEDPANSRPFVSIILAKARQLTNIVQDLLILSSLESAKPPAAEPISLRQSIQSALRTVEPMAKTRGINLVCESFPDMEVLGYEIRLEQVWVNLLENAIKFNRPEGEVRVDVVRNPEQALVRVCDTGSGIPSRDLPRIFERFYRVDKARSRATGGTGLGLAIVKHAVEQMGGSVSVESRLGQGSVFTVALPPFENNLAANER